MDQKRSVEHYKDHEIVCTATPDTPGWHYKISIVSHDGDDSAVQTESSKDFFPSDTAALQAASTRARKLVDDSL